MPLPLPIVTLFSYTVDAVYDRVFFKNSRRALYPYFSDKWQFIHELRDDSRNVVKIDSFQNLTLLQEFCINALSSRKLALVMLCVM